MLTVIIINLLTKSIKIIINNQSSISSDLDISLEAEEVDPLPVAAIQRHLVPVLGNAGTTAKTQYVQKGKYSKIKNPRNFTTHRSKFRFTCYLKRSHYLIRDIGLDNQITAPYGGLTRSKICGLNLGISYQLKNTNIRITRYLNSNLQQI